MRLALLLTALLLAAPAARAACADGTPGEPAMRAELFFGRNVKGGGTVDAAAWADFLATAVTPRFPDGMTVLDGYGQWRQRASGRVISEPSSVVLIVTAPTAENRGKFEAIRAEYKARFSQESVGLVTGAVCADW